MLSKFMRMINLVKRLCEGEDISAIRLSEDVWDRQYRLGKWDYLTEGTPNLALIVWRILKEAKKRPQTTLRVLDVGCGNGALPRFLAKTNINFVYTGVDISAEALSQAHSVYPAGNFIQHSIETPIKIPGVFDFIVFNETLYYVNAQRTLSTYDSFLATSGFLIISMYKTARTKYIWRKIHNRVQVNEAYKVYDTQRKVAWNIEVCTPKKISQS